MSSITTVDAWVRKLGAEHLPEATNLFLKLPLSEASKRKILWDSARLYNLAGAA